MANTFATAAARLLYTVDAVYEAGRRKEFIQLDTNVKYAAVRGGVGAECWEEIGRDRVVHALSVHDARLVSSAGDVGNIAAIGGHLASDTVPILRGDAAETQEISWATGQAQLICWHIPLRSEVSGGDISGKLDVYSGSTDPATFAVESAYDGGTVVVDSADDAATKSATRHTITFTIAAADIPDGAKQMTLMLTPGAHATNATQFLGGEVSY